MFPLYLKKVWATQKCDLVCDKWDHRGSGFRMLLSYAWAKPANGMYSQTRLSETGVSTKQEKEQRWANVYKRTVTSSLFIPTKRKSPISSPVVISSFLGQPVTNPDTCYSQVWRKPCKGSASPISKWPVHHATMFLCEKEGIRQEISSRTKTCGSFHWEQIVKSCFPMNIACLFLFVCYGFALPPRLAPNM